MSNDLLRRALYVPAKWIWRRRSIQRPIDRSHVKRVLLLRYDAIGDMIVTLPMIDAISELMPGVVVDVIASPLNRPLIEGDRNINAIAVFDRTIRGLYRVWKQLRHFEYDVVFSLIMNKTTLAGVIANVIGGRRSTTVAFKHTTREALYGTWFNIQVPISRNVETMAEMQLRMLSYVFGHEVDRTRYPLRLPVTSENVAHAYAMTGWMRGRRIVLNLSAGNAYRMWSEDRNTALVMSILQALPDATILIMGYGDRLAMAQHIASVATSRIHAYAGSSEFLNVAAVLGEVDMVVSPDTSIVHASAAMGTPVVVMYTRKATFIDEWRPYGVPFRSVITEGRDDLEALKPDDVMAAILDLDRSLRGAECA